MSMTLLGAKARGRFGVAVGLSFFCCAVAQAQPIPDAMAQAASQNTIKLTTVVEELPAGTLFLSATQAIFCVNPVLQRTSAGGRNNMDVAPYAAAFKTEFAQSGLKVVTAEDNLFGQEDSSAADYQVAAVVTDMRVKACVYTESGLGFTVGDARGDSSMTIDWQVYSPLKKQVVARITTRGTAKLEKSIAGGVQHLIVDAFASNARELAANSEFRTAMNATKPAPNELLKPSQNGPIALSGSLKAAKHSIADAVGSVVTLETGSGSGSAVLVSDDGYMITDSHVVGDEKEVRVRWADGIENVGQVIRVAKDRDVALIKTSARDRSPLPLKRGAVTPGQRVFAIGSPKGKDFQGTVSSGVVSAERTIRGLRYIQSDVSVSFGSSGGPLLDADGSVIGFTDLGIPNAGQPAGLNLFTPIGDAMDFLNLEQR